MSMFNWDVVLTILSGIIQFALASLGAAVSFSPSIAERNSRKLIVAFLAFGILGIVTIATQGTRASRAQASLDQSLADLETKQASLETSQTQVLKLQDAIIAQGRVISSLSIRNVDEITGGKSFCYVEIRPIDKQSLVAMLLSKGKYPVSNVDGYIVDEDLFHTGINPYNPEVFTKSKNPFQLPFVRVGSFATDLGRYVLQGKTRSFNAQIVARNGIFQQITRLRQVDGNWFAANIVSVSFYDGVRGVVLESVDKGFPIETLNNDSEWNDMKKLPHISL